MSISYAEAIRIAAEIGMVRSPSASDTLTAEIGEARRLKHAEYVRSWRLQNPEAARTQTRIASEKWRRTHLAVSRKRVRLAMRSARRGAVGGRKQVESGRSAKRKTSH